MDAWKKILGMTNQAYHREYSPVALTKGKNHRCHYLEAPTQIKKRIGKVLSGVHPFKTGHID